MLLQLFCVSIILMNTKFTCAQTESSTGSAAPQQLPFTLPTLPPLKFHAPWEIPPRIELLAYRKKRQTPQEVAAANQIRKELEILEKRRKNIAAERAKLQEKGS
ncbi:unnamed protein product [Gongylonema pulchrum]|uniref:Uncharacterized protein n=1 Tax=Gongylonema pulchrum TaxID=637853 RepID=A0A183CY75_9BILA|nr:unnamed protein product [Gongylonema pulchrum]